MQRTTLLSYLFEVLGVLLIGAVLGVNFGWSWALAPVAAYLLVLGVTLGSRS